VNWQWQDAGDSVPYILRTKRTFPPQEGTARQADFTHAKLAPPSSAVPCDAMSCSAFGKRYPAESAPQGMFLRKEHHEAGEKVGGGRRAKPATFLVTFAV